MHGLSLRAIENQRREQLQTQRVELVLKRRHSDWHAHIYNQPALWACGSTKDEAIGELLRTHGKALGIIISEPL